jgi:hypothetical protein
LNKTLFIVILLIGDIGFNNNFEINKSICQSDGKWSEIKFQCTSKYLFSPPPFILYPKDIFCYLPFG